MGSTALSRRLGLADPPNVLGELMLARPVAEVLDRRADAAKAPAYHFLPTLVPDYR